MEGALIEQTFEIAAQRCDDLTPLVYGRLLAQQPQMEALFCLDTNHQVRGEMLSQVIRTILDFVGERLYGANLIRSEVMTHAGYDVPPAVFATFFGVVAETLRDVLGDDWTPQTDAAWRQLLAELEFCATHPHQNDTAELVPGV